MLRGNRIFMLLFVVALTIGVLLSIGELIILWKIISHSDSILDGIATALKS